MGIKMDFKSMHKDLEKTKKRIDRYAKDEMEKMARTVFADTQAAVPRDTGALARSGNLTGRGFDWEIKYGNSDVDGVGVYYAAAVHNRRARHPIGQMKYVEEPFINSIFQWMVVMHRAMQKAFR